MYKARESMMLGYAVVGLFGLWCLYQMYWWFQYKVSKVKRDKKRVRELIAQDLPGKQRYPIFSIAAGLCCTMDADGLIRDGNAGEKSAAVATPPPTAIIDASHHTYTGQGAYMDGPANFVDLEANMQHSRVSNDAKWMNKWENTSEEEEEGQLGVEPLAPAVVVNAKGEEKPAEVLIDHTQGGSVSDLSDASGEEGAGSSENQSMGVNVVITEEPVRRGSATTDSWEDGPSDDGGVVYTISSSDDEGESNIV